VARWTLQLRLGHADAALPSLGPRSVSNTSLGKLSCQSGIETGSASRHASFFGRPQPLFALDRT